MPGLATVLVGDDPASRVYVGTKERACAEVGIRSVGQRLPAATATADLVRLVDELNARPDVHGILVQLPLPADIDSDAVIQAIAPAKDVDGLTSISQGRLLARVAGTPSVYAARGHATARRDAVRAARARRRWWSGAASWSGSRSRSCCSSSTPP